VHSVDGTGSAAVLVTRGRFITVVRLIKVFRNVTVRGRHVAKQTEICVAVYRTEVSEVAGQNPPKSTVQKYFYSV